MKREFQKRHKASKGFFTQTLFILFGIFLLIQNWLEINTVWPIFIILIEVTFIIILYNKQKSMQKKLAVRKD